MVIPQASATATNTSRREVTMVEVWTLEAVADRFTEAARTARRLPRVAVQGYVSAWPVIVRSELEGYPNRDKLYRLPPPSPKDVELMLEVMHWVQVLEVEERLLVWMRAKRYDWQEISRRFACDRTTAWRRWKRDMQVITDRLNQVR
jgi:hypothetical protein